MADESGKQREPRFWIIVIAIVILLVFLYFFKPFESYLVENIPDVHFSNVVFWFASLVGVIGYAIAHWQSFRSHIIGPGGRPDAEGLVFDTLQIAILIAVIFCAGGALQAVEMLGAHLVDQGPIIDPAFGEKLLAIILLVILAILFCLLHYLVRAVRRGWSTRRAPPRTRPNAGAAD